MGQGPAFGMPPPFDSSLQGAPGINPNSKHASYDVGAVESLAPQPDAPSPKGAASQGALENPAPAGGNQPAIDEKPAQDMLSIFNEASDEDRDDLTKQQTEALAPHGKSLEGGFLDVLKQGGPQAMARASQFGIDMTQFANQLNPAKEAEAEVGQAFGQMPTEEQSASGGPFKDQETALQDYQGVKKEGKEQAAAKKKAQRDAIAAFLMETGLRIMSSTRSDLGGAVGEAALGTMQSGANKRRQADQDSIAEQQRTRQNERQDKTDEAAALRAQQQTEEYEYGVTQRPAEEAKAARAGLESIKSESGVYYFDPMDPKAGKYVVDKDGKRVLAEDVGLSKESIEATARQRRSAINSKVEKIKALDEFERVELYPETDGLSGNVLRDKIIELAKSELLDQGSSSSAEDDPLGLL
jgi:hypothetical protein